MSTPARQPRSSTALIGLATVLGVVSMFAIWVRTQALDTEEWVSLTDDLLAEQEVRESLADFLVDQLYQELDIGVALAERLPDALDGVADTLATALREPATEATERLLSSDRFRSTWTAVNRTAHSALVAILRDDTRDVVGASDGSVSLELRPLVINVGERLGLPTELLERLPDDAGSIVIFESDELSAAQTTVRVLDVVSWLALVVVIALFAAAVYLARGRRIETMRNVGAVLVGAGVFVLVLRSFAVRRLIDSIVEDPANEALADVVAANATELIRRMAWSSIVWGALIVLFTALLGERAWARWTRRRIAPAMSASGSALAGSTALAVLLVLWWSPGRAFDSAIMAATAIALLIVGVVALRRRVLQEVPSRGTPLGFRSSDRRT